MSRFIPTPEQKAKLERKIAPHGAGQSERDPTKHVFPEQRYSGEWIARQIGVSRTALWRWLEKDDSGNYLPNRGMREGHWLRLCELFPDLMDEDHFEPRVALEMLCNNLDDERDADLLRSIAERVGAV